MRYLFVSFDNYNNSKGYSLSIADGLIGCRFFNKRYFTIKNRIVCFCRFDTICRIIFTFVRQENRDERQYILRLQRQKFV